MPAEQVLAFSLLLLPSRCPSESRCVVALPCTFDGCPPLQVHLHTGLAPPPCVSHFLCPVTVHRSHNEAIKGYLRRTVLPNLRMKRGPFLLQVRACLCVRACARVWGRSCCCCAANRLVVGSAFADATAAAVTNYPLLPASFPGQLWSLLAPALTPFRPLCRLLQSMLQYIPAPLPPLPPPPVPSRSS
jgi:hypothetical protein